VIVDERHRCQQSDRSRMGHRHAGARRPRRSHHPRRPCQRLDRVSYITPGQCPQARKWASTPHRRGIRRSASRRISYAYLTAPRSPTTRPVKATAGDRQAGRRRRAGAKNRRGHRGAGDLHSELAEKFSAYDFATVRPCLRPGCMPRANSGQDGAGAFASKARSSRPSRKAGPACDQGARLRPCAPGFRKDAWRSRPRSPGGVALAASALGKPGDLTVSSGSFRSSRASDAAAAFRSCRPFRRMRRHRRDQTGECQTSHHARIFRSRLPIDRSMFYDVNRLAAPGLAHQLAQRSTSCRYHLAECRAGARKSCAPTASSTLLDGLGGKRGKRRMLEFFHCFGRRAGGGENPNQVPNSNPG